MLRRKIKRQRVSSANEESEVSSVKHGREKSPVKDGRDCQDLEKLVFADQQQYLDLETDVVAEDDLIYSENSGLNEENLEKAKEPAWVDEDDCNISVNILAENRLKKFRDGGEDIITGDVLKKKLETQFKKIYGAPTWASFGRKDTEPTDDDDEDANEILLHAGNLLSAKSDSLPRGVIDIEKMKDANCSKPLNASVKCLEFHPNSKIFLTAGFNNTLSIFQVDGQTNANLQNIFVKDFPIHTAHFILNGQQVILASRRRYFYCYDMVAGNVTRIPEIRGKEERNFEVFYVSPDGKYLVFIGKSGYIYLLSSKTKQWVGDLKMNGLVYAIAFSADGSRMVSAGSDGDVYIWDMETKKCLHKFKDEGCLRATALALSPNGRYLACGSDSGVVNIYDNSSCFVDESPKPVKTVMNLTTQIHLLKFNSTSEILGISSKSIKNAFRLVHLPTLSVFSNWPTSKTPLRYVESFDFSPRSGYLAIGNDRGRALLFRLNHYTDA